MEISPARAIPPKIINMTKNCMINPNTVFGSFRNKKLFVGAGTSF